MLTTLLGAGAAAYLLVAGQRLRTWGTRGDEATRPLASEVLMPEPGAALAHAITIDAPPDRVWPWIAQLGQDKGGFWFPVDLHGDPRGHCSDATVGAGAVCRPLGSRASGRGADDR